MIRSRSLVMCTTVLGVMLVACSGGDGTTVRTVVPGERTAAVGANYRGPTTSIEQLDSVIAIAASGDDIELAAITGYALIPCQSPPEAENPGPSCRENEEAGTPVEVLPSFNDCARAWVRPEQAPDAYREALDTPQHDLIAAFRPAPGLLELDAEYVAVMTTEADRAVALFIRDGRVIAIEQPCSGNIAGLTDPGRVAESLPLSGDAPTVTPP